MKACKFGTHRVLEPKGVLPQPAWKIDNTMDLYDNEILINVKTLNIDSASFTQIKQQANGNEQEIAKIMLDTVAKRGKHHNPVTGSGGMLIGTVEKIGNKLQGKTDLKIGDKLATLVSLSLTPLQITKIKKIKVDTDQVDIEGKAILFESGIYAKLPTDMPEKLALSVLDVAGAPAQVARLVQSNQSVLVVGAAGKSGLLCLHEAKKRVGIAGKVVALCYSQAGADEVAKLNLADEIIICDATNAVAMMNEVARVTNNEMIDVTINCVNVPNTEMGSIMATKEDGTIYFFSMATSFTAAALGAEGVGRDVQMIIGNGYCKNHADIAIQVLRENKELRKLYEKRYA
ncbi:L-erythro-3,5-diaminohexanoate dehydrogenase [Clostridium sp. 'deep sea']|uniref:L-erythro-3,5-diaminohexanoate dehydrogenase n=1 Tax=Clostridium sp. 'deep sea' TaxID=2779445 RepID=UPI0018969DA8|nr:L-erythro-3,5-diaminohexanoate dehydrogenase [Clostridium sp. 'deep sea']QOR34789.1 L-erythro-3,5-diaminohexanoate dehydrogenase [Clostridium sp. 'deep sea']